MSTHPVGLPGLIEQACEDEAFVLGRSGNRIEHSEEALGPRANSLAYNSLAYKLHESSLAQRGRLACRRGGSGGSGGL
jgi:hypothetical protein